MPRTSSTRKAETFTFRLDPALKKALARSAADEHMQPAELVRELVRDYVIAKERRVFEIEARRQSLAIAQRVRGSANDEAQVMRDIDANLERDDFAHEWKA
jgi:predicted transcriptional regulator